MMAIAYLVTLLIALGIAFVNPVISFILYFLIVVAVIILTAIGKWELVTTLPVRQRTDEQSTSETSDS